ncbi:unnamed protein product [Didymodactylos carnosus]|uniref:Uncharacterized protein n=1 Tax=Didymodactylos carnosus TaxID=1234261 RepID=A0A8S2EIL2_9BILA|nr:unnamed protein product [Didymodactylos carnosus]CAF4043873.1 unnamed protein product [Didymodactylos carnosus]
MLKTISAVSPSLQLKQKWAELEEEVRKWNILNGNSLLLSDSQSTYLLGPSTIVKMHSVAFEKLNVEYEPKCWKLTLNSKQVRQHSDAQIIS